MMALDFQPFSIVEDTGFTALINHLDPRYDIPSRKYFSTTLIPEMYDQANEKVKKTFHSKVILHSLQIFGLLEHVIL